MAQIHDECRDNDHPKISAKSDELNGDDLRRRTEHESGHQYDKERRYTRALS